MICLLFFLFFKILTQQVAFALPPPEYFDNDNIVPHESCGCSPISISFEESWQVNQNQLSFLGSLYAYKKVTENFAHVWPMCLGMLLNKDYVLLTAHCVTSSRLSKQIQNFRFSLGSDHDLRNLYRNPNLTSGISEIIIHPEYNPNSITGPNDVALLKMSKSFELGPETGYVKFYTLIIVSIIPNDYFHYYYYFRLYPACLIDYFQDEIKKGKLFYNNI